MNKKNIFLLIFAIILFIASLAFVLPTFNNNTTNTLNNSSNEITDTNNISDTSNTSDSTSEDLPDLNYASLIDFTYSNKENKEFNISRYKDKPLAILFSDFSGSYDTSVEYLSLLNSFFEKYKSNVQFLCIDKSNFVDTDSNIEVYKNINGIENYSIETLPTLIFIDKEGEIINQTTSITLDSLEANLDLITGNF